LAELAVATILVGHQYALVGATVAHELVHRRNNPVAVICSCVLLGFTFNTGFLLFHFRGHHRLVGLREDPATARRGESWANFLPRSIAGQTKLVFGLEAERLRRRGRGPISSGNRLFARQLYSLTVAVVAWEVAGTAALATFLVAALIGRVLHETINYVQHYGVVRRPGEPVAPWHTWDCTHRLSNALQYNLPFHSVHHMSAARPFWELKPDERAPRLPHGYQTMAMLALAVPFWNRVMEPLVQNLDAQFQSHATTSREPASEGEHSCRPAISA
jgi:alkane 1-monooxygenase